MTKTLAVYICSLLLLLITVLASARAGREVAVSDFPMDQIPAKIGQWQWEKPAAATPSKPDASREVRTEHRLYRAPDGSAIGVNLKVTSSRIGSLRDFATALIADGWLPGETSTWETTPRDSQYQIQAQQQVLRKGPGRMYTLNWYVSTRGQAGSLREAVFAGWLAKISGDPLWGQAYLTMVCKEEQPEANGQVLEFAAELFPIFRTLLLQYANRKLPTSQPTGERN